MEQVFDHSKHRDVIGIPLDETIKSNVVLAWLKNKRFSQATRAFVDFISKMIAPSQLEENGRGRV